MRRIVIPLFLAALLLALPNGAWASHVSRSDFKSASNYCKALRAEVGGKAFKKKFHAKRIRGAQRRCVKRSRSVRAMAPVTSFPPPTDACTPATEPAFPVRAFAGDSCAQPAPVVSCDEDEDADDADDEHADDQGDDATQSSETSTCEDTSDDDGNQAGDDEDEHHSDDSDDGDSDDD